MDDKKVFNFFVLTGGSKEDPVIKRISISNDIQKDLSVEFFGQLEEFRTDTTEIIEYDGQYTPDSDELLAIKNFSLSDEIKRSIDNPISVQDIENSIEGISGIFGIFCGEKVGQDYRVLFQVFDKRRIIQPNKFSLIFGDNNSFTLVNANGLSLDTRLTALYENGTLLFKTYYFARRLFQLSEYNRIATNEEVQSLGEYDHFQGVESDLLLELADEHMRRKIMRIKRNEIFEKFSAIAIKEKAIDVGLPDMFSDEGSIILNGNKKDNKKNLKLYLSLLDDQVFIGPMSEDTRISNSSKKL